jgi:hypothetical protein
VFNYLLQGTAQRLVLAAAAGQARHLPLPKPSLARGAYPQAAKPLSAANDVGWLHGTQDSLPEKQYHCQFDKIMHEPLTFSIAQKPDLSDCSTGMQGSYRSAGM